MPFIFHYNDPMSNQIILCSLVEDHLTQLQGRRIDWLHGKNVPVTDKRGHAGAARLETKRAALAQDFSGQLKKLAVIENQFRQRTKSIMSLLGTKPSS